MNIKPDDWFGMDTAPRDGTSVLACRHNGCGWDHDVVWWTGREEYPWQADYTAYPEGRLDYWQPLSIPYDPQKGWDEA